MILAAGQLLVLLCFPAFDRWERRIDGFHPYVDVDHEMPGSWW